MLTNRYSYHKHEQHQDPPRKCSSPVSIFPRPRLLHDIPVDEGFLVRKAGQTVGGKLHTLRQLLLLVDSNHLYSWLKSGSAVIVRGSDSEHQGMHCTSSQLEHPTSRLPLRYNFLSGRYAALVTFYFCPHLHHCF